MNAQPRYVLDANVFMEANRRYYAFDLCPGYWKFLVHQNAVERIYSIDPVFREIQRGRDKLAGWCKEPRSLDMFLATDNQKIIHAYREVVRWVNAQPRFTRQATSEFLAKADPWIVAAGMAGDFVVVTHEEPRPESRKRVSIPDVASAFSVQVANTFEMLRDLRARFEWDAPTG